MDNYKQVAYRRVSTLGLLAAVPYLLLSASQSVELRTVVELDGSGLRQYTITYEGGRGEEVNKWLQERTSEHARQLGPRREGPLLVINRDWRAADAEKLPASGEPSLDMRGIVDNPLSIWTYYRWSEQLEIYRDRATQVETPGAPKAVLEYQLQMPGRVLRDSVSGSGLVEGNTVSWKLSADLANHTLEARSRRVRWGYLLVLIYIVGFIIFQLTRYVAQMMRYRPRKI